MRKLGLPFRYGYGLLAIGQVAKCIKTLRAVDVIGVVLHLIDEVYPAYFSLPDSKGRILSAYATISRGEIDFRSIRKCHVFQVYRGGFHVDGVDSSVKSQAICDLSLIHISQPTRLRRSCWGRS